MTPNSQFSGKPRLRYQLENRPEGPFSGNKGEFPHEKPTRSETWIIVHRGQHGTMGEPLGTHGRRPGGPNGDSKHRNSMQWIKHPVRGKGDGESTAFFYITWHAVPLVNVRTLQKYHQQLSWPPYRSLKVKRLEMHLEPLGLDAQLWFPV